MALPETRLEKFAHGMSSPSAGLPDIPYEKMTRLEKMLKADYDEYHRVLNEVAAVDARNEQYGGHAIVAELPEKGKKNTEYFLFTDPTDCSTYQASYVFNEDCGSWVKTSGGDGSGTGGGSKYTFTQTDTGFNAYEDGVRIFTYNDSVQQGHVYTYQDNDDGWTVFEDGTQIYTHTDKNTDTTYTFALTTNGWSVSSNGQQLFSYNDKDTNTTYLFTPTDDGFEVSDGTNTVFTYNDPKYTFATTDTGFKVQKDGTDIFNYTDSLGADSDGTYKTTSTLSEKIDTVTNVLLSTITDLTPADIVVGETLVYDATGTVGKIESWAGNNAVIRTITTAPGERRGVRLGAVDDQADLPATTDSATTLGWQSPLQGDYAYVRTDSAHDGHLTEYLVQSVSADGTITWAYSHTMNAGDYVVDINTADGTTISKNQDGTVTLPQDANTTYTFADTTDGFKVTGSDNSTYSFTGKGNTYTFAKTTNGFKVTGSDGTSFDYTDNDTKGIIGNTAPDAHTKGTVGQLYYDMSTNYAYVLESVDNTDPNDIIYTWIGIKGISDTDTQYEFSTVTNSEGKTTGFKVKEKGASTDLYTYTDPDDKSDGAYFTTTTLSTDIDTTTTVPASTVNGLIVNDIVIDETLIYDADGTLGRVSAKDGDDLTVTTMTVSGSAGVSTTNVTYNTERQGEELKSSYAVITGGDFTPTIDAIVPFKQMSGTFEQPEVGEFIIPDGTRIEADFNLTSKGDKSTSNVRFAWFNITDNKQLPTGVASTFNDIYQKKYLQYPRTNLVQWTNDTGHAVTIALKVITVDQTTDFSSDGSSLTIQEIGRIVDPMKYADNSKGFEDVPVGSIVEMYQDTAPAHYLICDGTEYNIGSHPELEAKIVEQFGKLNQFGGDGVKTYAVPDLRTEESVTPKPVSASSPYTVSATSVGNGQPASLSFNGELDGGWLPDLNSTEEQYIRIDFTQKTWVGKYELFTRTLDHNDLVVFPRDFTLEGSNDNGATWEVLDTRTGETAGDRQQRHTYEVATPGFYTSYRIGATANNGLTGASSYTWAVGEINLIGSSPLQKFIKYESTMKAFYGAGNYKVSGTFQIPSAGAWRICNLTGTTGDTDMVQDGKIVVPQTGWYSLTAQYGVATTNGMSYFVTWQNRSDVVDGTSQLDKNLCMNYKGTGSYGANTLSGTAYLEKGDIVTLQMRIDQALANTQPTFTVAFMGSDITINQVNLIGADDVYSAEEQMIGSYLGKPLYKKTVTHQITSTRTIFDLSVISPNIDKHCIVKYKGRMINADNGMTVAGIPCYYTNVAFADCWFNDDGVHIITGTQYGIAGNICEITYYYTKTTDTAGSAPNKNSLLLTRPDLWEVGVEYDFGGGLYGQRFTADSFTPLAIVEYVEGVSNIVNSFGTVQITSGDTKIALPFSTVNQSDSNCTYPYFSIRDIVNGKGTLSITSGALRSTQVGNGWDAWATYTK